MCVCADYFCDQVGDGGILTYDARKGTLRLTGQTVLWLLGPWGTSEKAMSPTCWRDFHSYWTSHNIWDTFGTNSLIKRTVRERGRVRETERKGRRGLLCVWLQWEQERGTRILRKKKKLIWPFPVNANFQMDSIMPLNYIHDNIPSLSCSSTSIYISSMLFLLSGRFI